MKVFIFLPGRFDPKMAVWTLDGQLININKKKRIPHKHLYDCDGITAAQGRGGISHPKQFSFMYLCFWCVLFQ